MTRTTEEGKIHFASELHGLQSFMVGKGQLLEILMDVRNNITADKEAEHMVEIRAWVEQSVFFPQ